MNPFYPYRFFLKLSLALVAGSGLSLVSLAKVTTRTPAKKMVSPLSSSHPAAPSTRAGVSLPAGADWQQFDIQSGDQLQIEGLRGDVNVTFVDAGAKMAIRIRQGGNVENQLAVRDHRVIGIRTPTQLSASAWDQVSSGQIAPIAYQVDVVSGPIPTLIAWREGQVKVAGNKQGLTVTGVKGHLELTDNSAAIKSQWSEGTIQVNGNRGALSLATVSAQIQVEDSEGNIQIQNHVGKTKLKNIQGDLKFTSFRGGLVGENLKVGMDIQAGVASINLKGLSGNLRGQNEQGDTVVQLGPGSTMKFESDRGDVRVRLGKGRGVRVNLATEGRLLPPANLRVAVEGRRRVTSGRVGGEDPSTVTIHSKTGQISVGM